MDFHPPADDDLDQWHAGDLPLGLQADPTKASPRLSPEHRAVTLVPGKFMLKTCTEKRTSSQVSTLLIVIRRRIIGF